VRTVGALRRFGVAAFRRRDLTDAEPALERRRIAHPKGLGLRRLKGLQQGFAVGEMGFNNQFALQNPERSLSGGSLADIPARPPDVRFTLKRDTARHCCYVQFVSRRHLGDCWI
jgi:hypothetical protein